MWLGCAGLLPQWWRNDRGLHTDTPPPDWGSRDSPVWRAAARSWPVVAVTFLLLIPPIVVLEVIAADSAVAQVLSPVSGALVVALLVTWVTVPLANRPRFLVAPHHRALPGLLAERRGVTAPPVAPPRHPPKWHRRRAT
jgi:hypothetical protein